MSDCNTGYDKWVNMSVSPPTCSYDAVLLHVDKEARFRGEHHSLLDLVFAKDRTDIVNISYLDPKGSSDHLVITFSLIVALSANIPA